MTRLAPHAPPPPNRTRWLASALDARWFSWLLVALVFASIIPELGLEEHLALPLFALFTCVGLARLLTLPPDPRTSSVALVLLELGVAVTFLPLSQWLPALSPDLLQTLRVSRLLFLLRPSAGLLLDLWGIMTRRERLAQFALVTLGVALISTLAATVLINLAPHYDYNNDGNPWTDTFIDVFWWSFRQLESADNLVPTVRSAPLVVAISLLMTVTGVFVIAFIIGIGASVVEQVVIAQRRRKIDYHGHTVIIGPVHSAEILVEELVGILEKNRSLRSVGPLQIARWLLGRGPRPRRHALPLMALLGDEDAPPDYLFEPHLRWVQYRRGDPTHPTSLELVGAQSARRVVLLTRPELGDEADALTLATLAAVRGLAPEVPAYVELLDANNRPLVEAIGGGHTLALDMPRLMGQFLCQHLVVPGVDHIYRELLTAEGCEFYTHVFVEQWEREGLRRCAQSQTISWRNMQLAAQRRGLILLGVLLGEEGFWPQVGPLGVTADQLTVWLNPEEAPHAVCTSLGAQPGLVPTSTLKGLVALCPSYRDLREFARVLLLDPARELTQDDCSDSRDIASALVHDDGHLGQVMVVGDSRALRSLVSELMLFRPQAEIVLLLPRELRAVSLERRLGGLPLHWETAVGNPESTSGLMLSGPAGGKLRLFINPGESMGQFAVEVAARQRTVDAAVFLSEGRGADPDARTSLRALRFAAAFREGQFQRGAALHLLVELRAQLKGELLEQSLLKVADPPTRERLRLTQISTERISNFFLVHSAFVPGVQHIWDELLGDHGQNLLRMTWKGRPGEVPWGHLSGALADRGLLAIAYQLRLPGGGVQTWINPAPGEPIDTSRLVCVYALGDVQWDQLHPPPGPPPSGGEHQGGRAPAREGD